MWPITKKLDKLKKCDKIYNQSRRGNDLWLN